MWGGVRHLGEGAKISVFSQDLAQVCTLMQSIHAKAKTVLSLKKEQLVMLDDLSDLKGSIYYHYQ